MTVSIKNYGFWILNRLFIIAVDDSAFAKVVWGYFEGDRVSRQDAYVIFAHPTRDVSGYAVTILQFNAEHSIG